MNAFFFFLTVVSILLETSTMSLPLTASLITAMSLVLGFDAAGIAFAAGLLFDLFALRPLGLSGLYFLLVCFVAGRYQSKIFSGNTFYTIIFLFAATVGYQFLFFRLVDIERLVISVTISLTFLVIVNRFLPHHSGTKGKLKV